MQLLTNEEAKKYELDILLHLASFCETHGLKYFLAYGTLIGAVRHKGFIPWDDDIDVHMPRKDYNCLIENFNKESADGRYRLIAPMDKNSHHSIVKIIDLKTVKIETYIHYKKEKPGIDIDVFPLDGEPGNDEEYNVWYNKMMKVYRLYDFCISPANLSIKRRIAIPLIRLFCGKKRLLRRAQKLHSRYSYENAKYIGSVESFYNSRKNRFSKDWFEKVILLDFEGHKLRAPIGYDNILRQVYGDYMQLPPPEKRVAHHACKMYLK